MSCQAIHNKLLKFTPAAKDAASAGRPKRCFGRPLAERYVNMRVITVILLAILSNLAIAKDCLKPEEGFSGSMNFHPLENGNLESQLLVRTHPEVCQGNDRKRSEGCLNLKRHLKMVADEILSNVKPGNELWFAEISESDFQTKKVLIVDQCDVLYFSTISIT